MRRQEFWLIVYGTFLSSLIGVISFLFLLAEKNSSHLIWEIWGHLFPFPILYKAVVILLGATLLYQFKEKWGNLPRASHDLIEELKETQRVDYARTWHGLGLALIILTVGAGVGPEAPLLGAVIAFSIWQADKLRYLKLHSQAFAQLALKDKLIWLFHPYRYLQVYSAEEKLSKRKKIYFAINGLVVFLVLMKMTEQPSFITKLGSSAWQVKDLLVFLPLLLYGYGLGKLYLYVVGLLKQMLNRLDLSVFARVFLGAGAIFLIALFTPYLMFSGQHSMHLVLELGLVVSPLALIALSLLKLLFLDICMETGWSGGDIFPISFASILQGYALAQLLPNFDPLFVVLVVSIAMAASILKQEVIAVIFIALFFPLNLWPIAGMILAMLFLFKKGIAKWLQV